MDSMNFAAINAELTARGFKRTPGVDYWKNPDGCVASAGGFQIGIADYVQITGPDGDFANILIEGHWCSIISAARGRTGGHLAVDHAYKVKDAANDRLNPPKPGAKNNHAH